MKYATVVGFEMFAVDLYKKSTSLQHIKISGPTWAERERGESAFKRLRH